jgi:acetate kinase
VNVLVLNCGSSSLKYSLLAMPQEREIARGEAQRVGPKTAEPARIVHRQAGRTETVFVEMPDHGAAFAEVSRLLDRNGAGLPDAVAHRVVHGGTRFDGDCVLDPRAVAALDEIVELAPIHNPPAVALIKRCNVSSPELPQVLVFDTSYHATIPEAARTYALPASLRESLGLRK